MVAIGEKADGFGGICDFKQSQEAVRALSNLQHAESQAHGADNEEDISKAQSVFVPQLADSCKNRQGRE